MARIEQIKEEKEHIRKVKFRKYDKKRFKDEYPIIKKRAEVINFVSKATSGLVEHMGKEVELPTYVKIEMPYTVALSKNTIGYANGRPYVKKETREAQDFIGFSLLNSKKDFVQGKVWIDILVQKPQARGDAVNYVDRICDAIQKSLGINDSWFSIRCVDWEVVKKDPKIIIGVGQESNEPMKICSLCGRTLPIDPYFSKQKITVRKEYQNCRSCRSRKIDEIRL